MIDLLNPKVLKKKIEKNLKIKTIFFEKYFWKTAMSFDRNLQ